MVGRKPTSRPGTPAVTGATVPRPLTRVSYVRSRWPPRAGRCKRGRRLLRAGLEARRASRRHLFIDDDLNGEDVLARSALALMLGVPGTGASRCVAGEPDAVLDVGARHHGLDVLAIAADDADTAASHELAGIVQARVQRLDKFQVERAARGGSRPPPPGQSRRARASPARPVPRRPRRGRGRTPGPQRRDRRGHPSATKPARAAVRQPTDHLPVPPGPDPPPRTRARRPGSGPDGIAPRLAPAPTHWRPNRRRHRPATTGRGGRGARERGVVRPRPDAKRREPSSGSASAHVRPARPTPRRDWPTWGDPAGTALPLGRAPPAFEPCGSDTPAPRRTLSATARGVRPSARRRPHRPAKVPRHRRRRPGPRCRNRARGPGPPASVR